MTLAAVGWLVKQGYSCYTELGLQAWGSRRADVIATNLKQAITIVEVKSCAADFRTDSKWHTYLPYCSRMLFALPPQLLDAPVGQDILKAVKGHGVGVLMLDQQSGFARVVMRPQVREMKPKYVRAVLARMSWRGGEFSPRTYRRQRIFL